jgi:hypothetical protein
MATEERSDSNGRAWRSRNRIVLIGFLAIAAFFLWTEHRAHLLGILPYALFLLCPILHLFHHGHGGHGSGDERNNKDHH